MRATMNEVTLVAPDISCGHCVATIQEPVGALKGVTRAAADPETKQIQVIFGPQRVSLDQITATLDEAGYPVASS